MVVDKIMTHRRLNTPSSRITKRFSSPIEINPGLILSRLGAKEPARRSLDMMIMRPTWGVKLFSFVIAVLLITTMMGPAGAAFRADLIIWALVGGVLLYLVVFLSVYEVRYDWEGVTAPNTFFRPKFHPWSDFISIEQTDNVHYKLKFVGGTLKIKKFLVGMPTFLTFVTDIREMRKRP